MDNQRGRRLIGRRDAVGFLGTAAIGGLFAVDPIRVSRAEGDTPPSLKEAAATKGLLYGSNSEIELPEGPEAYRALFIDQCALYAPFLSWLYMSPKPGVEDFTNQAGSLQFAQDHGLRLTGAHLLWHEAVPEWFAALATKAEAQAAMAKRVQDVARHYAGRVYSWNVVNEALEPDDGRADGLRRSPLLDRLGPDFIATAFRLARAADPDALLVYNDFDLELDIAEHDAKREALFGLLDRLHEAEAPIQAVGIQSHLFRVAERFDETRFRGFLRDIASRGLQIIISELDIRDTDMPGDLAARDRAVADAYARYLPVCLDEPAVKAVVTWGLSDRYTWLTGENARRFVRRDGLPERPLPFDADFRPKLAFDAMLKAFAGAPVRS